MFSVTFHLNFFILRLIFQVSKFSVFKYASVRFLFYRLLSGLKKWVVNRTHPNKSTVYYIAAILFEGTFQINIESMSHLLFG